MCVGTVLEIHGFLFFYDHCPRLLTMRCVPVRQIGKFAECAGDLSYVQIACAAAFVSLNNSSIVSFYCFTKISRLESRLKFKVRGREIGCARQTFQSGLCGGSSARSSRENNNLLFKNNGQACIFYGNFAKLTA